MSPLICFDLGRVLVRICDDWRHACRIACVAAAPGELTAEQQARLMQVVFANEVGKIDQLAFANQAAPLLGLDIPNVLAMSDAYLLGLYDGVPELLDELAAAGIRTACLSNTNANHWRMMSDPSHAAAVPIHRLHYQFASHLVGLRKPDDAIYEYVERKTGVPGESIVFFDDVEENILAARKRRWQAHLIALDGDPVRQIRRRLSEAGILG